MHQCQWRADRSGQPKEVCFSATPSPHHRKSHAVDRVLPAELSANCALEPRVGPWAAQEISRTWHGPLARLPRAAGNLLRTALLRSQELLRQAGGTSAICTAHPETNGEPRHPRDLRTNRPLRRLRAHSSRPSLGPPGRQPLPPTHTTQPSRTT